MSKTVLFGDAVKAIEAGKRITRESWNGVNMFVFKQIPSSIKIDKINAMQSLPNTVKHEFEKRFLLRGDNKGFDIDTTFHFISFYDQMHIVKGNNTLFSYVPSVYDILAVDWIILDEDSPYEDTSNCSLADNDIGTAIHNLKLGKKVAREGWNGAGQYLYFVEAASYAAITNHARNEFGDNVPYRAYVAIKTAQGDVGTWSPSSNDVFSKDWVVVD